MTKNCNLLFRTEEISKVKTHMRREVHARSVRQANVEMDCVVSIVSSFNG